MGLAMYPSQVKEQLKSIDSGMETILNDVKSVSSAIDAFVGDANLEGLAYSQSKIYFKVTFLTLNRGIECLATSIKECNSKYITTYEADVDSDGKNLLEDELVTEIKTLEELAASFTKRINDASSKDDGSNTTEFLGKSRLEVNNTKRELEKKLENFRRFNVSSAGYYDTIKTLLASIEQGLSELKSNKGWNEQTKRYELTGLTLDWTTGIKDEFVKDILSEKQVNNLNKVGFTNEEIYDAYYNCSSKEDKIFFDHLASGEYEKAFNVDPDKLGDEVTVFAWQYSNKLVANAMEESANMNGADGYKAKELEKFINGMTAPSASNSQKGVFVEKYLEKMTMTSMASVDLMEMELALNTSGLEDKNSQEFKDKYHKMNNLMTTRNFWLTQNTTFNNLKKDFHHGSTTPPEGRVNQVLAGMKVENLTFTKILGENNFKISYDAIPRVIAIDSNGVPVKNKNGEIIVYSQFKPAKENKGNFTKYKDITISTVGKAGEDDIETLNLYRKIDKDKQTEYFKLMKTIAVLSVSAFNPLAGIAISAAADSALSTSSTQTDKFNSLAKSMDNASKEVLGDKVSGKLPEGSTSFLAGLAALWNFTEKMEQHEKKREDVSKDAQNNWFGSNVSINDDGISTTYKTNADLATIVVYDRWKKDGLSAVINGISDEEIKRIEKEYLAKKGTSKLTKEEKFILYGENSSNGDGTSYKDVDMEKFVDAVNEIGVVDNLPNISDNFQGEVDEIRREMNKMEIYNTK